VSEPEKKPRRRVKKVKGHGGGHHGGAWKVAYADFVTAMMALFLVLWLVSQADTKLKAAIANYFRSPGVFDQTAGGIVSGPKKVSKEPGALSEKDEEEALAGIATILKKKFETRPEFSRYKDQIKIEVTEQGLKIQIVDKANQVAFTSGSSELNPTAKSILDEIAHGICALPNPILIGGHTDRTTFPAGSTYTNWELSTDRANAARRELEASCVKPEQVRRIVGYADTEPLLPDNPYDESNRRISITVMRMAGSGESPADTDKNPEEEGEKKKSIKPDLSKPVESPIATPESGSAGSKPKEEPKPAGQKPPEVKPGDKKVVTVGTPDSIPANLKVHKEEQ
jgi:chemotaxis protein MotB